jgi:hypothetical protein
MVGAPAAMIRFPRHCGAGHRDHVDHRGGGELLAHLAVANYYVEHARRQIRLLGRLRDEHSV